MNSVSKQLLSDFVNTSRFESSDSYIYRTFGDLDLRTHTAANAIGLQYLGYIGRFLYGW